MKQCLRIVIVLCLAALVVGVPVVRAEWIEDGNIVCGDYHEQYDPSVVADGYGGMIVAWYDERSEMGYQIFAQRLDSDGNELWTSNGVLACMTPGSLGNIRLVPDGQGGAIISWQDWMVGPNTVFAQRIDGTGTPLWAADGDTVSLSGMYTFSYNMIADGAGGAIFFWMDERNGDVDLFGQRMSPGGTKLWDPDGIPVCVYTGNQDAMNIISNGDGTFILAWYDRRAGSNPDIYAQKIDTTGALYWDEDGMPVCTDPAGQYKPIIVSDGMGGAIIAWSDQRYGNYDVYGQRLNAYGDPLWDWDGVPIAATTFDEESPQIVSDGAGGAIVSFNAYLGYSEVLAQRVNSEGEIQWWYNGMLVSTGTWEKWCEHLCSDGEGGAIVGFYDSHNEGYWTIAAQRLDHNGASVWNALGIPLYTAGGDIDNADMTSDGAGGAFFAWVDDRNGGQYDVFASRLNPYGKLGGFWAPPEISSAADVPNDQGGRLSLRWDASAADTIPGDHIEYYSAWRLLPELGAEAITDRAPALPLEEIGLSSDFGGEAIRRMVTAAGDTWEWLANIPARQAESYGFTASSLYDSTASDPGWQYFVVTAHTYDPALFFDSPVDSGYSVDNLPPLQPLRFEGIQSLVPAGLKLYWEIGEDADLSHYAVYKGPAEDFVPDEGNLVGTAADTLLLDTSWKPGDEDFFKLAAVDIHGNESPYILLRPENIYVGTLLQSFHAETGDFRIELSWTLSEAGEEMTFNALRAEAGGAFAPLSGCVIERDGLSFTLKDGSCEPGVTYRYRIEVDDGGGSRVLFETDGITAPQMPLTLFQNAPNPFNPTTTIAFYLPERSHVRIDVYDVAGRNVATLLDGTQAAGRHTVTWNGQDDGGRAAASGVYFYRMRAEKFEQTKKMILLR
jgi:predicted lipoprotein with Yx(FWY)xxD motif